MTEQQFHSLVEALARPNIDRPISLIDEVIEILVAHGVLPPSGYTEGDVNRTRF